MRKHLSYANVVAMVALILSMAGTSYAAIVVTGKHVTDGSLKGVDIKDKSIGLVDLSTATRKELTGGNGERGPDGLRGNKGPNGLTGDQGDPGDAVRSTTSWAYHDTGLIRDRADANPDEPNPDSTDWDDYVADQEALRETTISDGAPFVVAITGTETVVGLSGTPDDPMSDQVKASAGTLETAYSANLSATATVTLMHRNAGQSDSTHTGGQVVHGRILCWLGYANMNSPNSFTKMGSASWASSEEANELVTLTLVANGGNQGAGSYNVVVLCKDGNPSDNQWLFVSGSVHAVAAEQRG